MCHDDDLTVRSFHDLLRFSFEPAKHGLVPQHMILDGPVLDVVLIIDFRTDKLFSNSCDSAKELTAEDRHGGREIVSRLVNEDELPTCFLLGFSLEHENTFPRSLLAAEDE